MASYKDIEQRIKKLQDEAAALKAKESNKAIAQARALIAEFGLTAEQLGFGKVVAKGKKGAKRGGASKPSEPKYRNPKTGATWSGIGRRPDWILKAKGDLSAFLIANQGGTAAPAPMAAKSMPAAAPKSVKPKAAGKAKKAVASKKQAAKPAVVAKPVSNAKVVAPVKQVAATPAKSATVKKVAAKKAPAKKAAAKKAKPVKAQGPASAAGAAKPEAAAPI